MIVRVPWCLPGCSADECVLVGGLRARLGNRDDVALHEVLQVLVERLHAERPAGLDRGVHLRDLRLADEVADGGRADHDLVRRDAAGAVLGLAQRLRDHRAQRLGEHRPDHLLFRGGEHVDDPVHRLGGRRGVQRAEHEVARLGRGHGEADGLQVAHLAHEDDVRVLAQGAPQRVGEGERVRADLALVDEALLGLVHELDRVLHREDVAVLVLVHVVHHRGERGGLSRARRARHQHQAARVLGDLGEDLGRLQLLEREHLRGNRPEDGAGAAVLVERVDAEAREVRDLEGEVDLQRFLVHLALAVVHDVVDHPVHVLVLERRHVDAAHVAVDADHGRQACGKVQVRSLVLHGECEQFGDVHRVRSLGGEGGRRGAGRLRARVKCASRPDRLCLQSPQNLQQLQAAHFRSVTRG